MSRYVIAGTVILPIWIATIFLLLCSVMKIWLFWFSFYYILNNTIHWCLSSLLFPKILTQFSLNDIGLLDVYAFSDNISKVYKLFKLHLIGKVAKKQVRNFSISNIIPYQFKTELNLFSFNSNQIENKLRVIRI